MRNGPLAVVTLIAETCWIYLLWIMLARLVGLETVIFPLLMVFTILIVGFGIARTTNAWPSATARIALAVIGTAMVYLAVAANPILAGVGSRILWPAAWISEGFDGKTIASIVLVSIGAVLGWRRGTQHGSEPVEQRRLMFLFKLGLAVMTLGTITEYGCGCTIGTLTFGSVFLVATLAGLAIERLPDDTTLDKDWATLFARAVIVLLGLSAIFGLAGAQWGVPALTALGEVWRVFITAVINVLAFVLAPILKAFFGFIDWLRERFGTGEGELVSRSLETPKPIDWSQFEAGEAWGQSVLGLLELVLVALFFLALVKVLAFPRKRPPEGSWDTSLVERERIRTAGESSSLFGAFLGELFPGWLRRPAAGSGDDAVRPGAIGLYFEVLRLANQRGHDLDLSDTPSERVEALEQTLQGAPVAEITTRFNDIRYGERDDELAPSEALKAKLYAQLDDDGETPP